MAERKGRATGTEADSRIGGASQAHRGGSESASARVSVRERMPFFGGNSGRMQQVAAVQPDPIAEKMQNAKRWYYTLWSLVAVCLLTVVGVYLLRILSIPVGVIISTVIVVFCLRGVVNGLEKRGVGRVLGTALAYLLMLLVIALVVFLMFSPMFGVSGQFESLVESLPGYVNSFFDWANALYVRYSSVLSNQTVQDYLASMAATLGESATALAKNSASSVMEFGQGAANLLIALGFGLVVAFWILIELPKLGPEVKRLGGPKHADTLDMLYLTFTRVVGGYIKGLLLQCTLIVVLSWLLFLVLCIPNSAALGVISGLLNVFPVIGPWLGGALAAGVGIFISPLIAVVAFIGSGIIQHGVYTFISPSIMANTVDIHPSMTLVGILVGSAVGGAMSGGMGGSLLGMLLAVPIMAAAKSIFVYYFEKRTGRQLVAEDGVYFQGVASPQNEVSPMADAMAAHGEKSLGQRMGEHLEQANARVQRQRERREYAAQGLLEQEGRVVQDVVEGRTRRRVTEYIVEEEIVLLDERESDVLLAQEGDVLLAQSAVSAGEVSGAAFGEAALDVLPEALSADEEAANGSAQQ